MLFILLVMSDMCPKYVNICRVGRCNTYICIHDAGFSTWVNKKSLQQVSRCHEEKFYIWKYHSAMNSSELPYYYHIFLVFRHKKLTFSLFWGYLETNCLLMASFYCGRWVITSKIWTKRQRSEWVKENPYAKWNPSFHPYTGWKT